MAETNGFLVAAGLLVGLSAAAACGDGIARHPHGDLPPGADGDALTGGDEDQDEGTGGEEDCVAVESFFRDEVWAPFMSTKCYACHNPAGAARHTDLVLRAADVPGYFDANLAALRDIARLEIDGAPLLLLKASAQVEHQGSAQLGVGDEHYRALEELVQLLEEPDQCTDDEDVDAFFEGVVFLDWEQTLRRALFNLAARRPTASELARARDEGADGVAVVLNAAMDEPGFSTRIREILGDVLLTDAFLPGTDALDLLDTTDYPSVDWWRDAGFDESDRKKAKNRSNDAIAREPLELARFIVENHRPFSDIVAADYTVVNPYSAQVYGLDLNEVGFADPEDQTEWREVQLDSIPHAGILTTPAFLNRYPTSSTNRNRARALFTMQTFLATDVMRLGARPIDGASVDDHNPTMDDPACTSCHEILDPVAGAFGNWDRRGRYRPGPWYLDMRPAGLGNERRPAADADRSLWWLGRQIADDPRFGQAVVRLLYRGITGQPTLTEPTDPLAADYAARVRAFRVQDFVLEEIAADYRAAGHELRTAVLQLVLSPYFRAANSDEVDEVRALELAGIGAIRLVTPEQLDRRIQDVLDYVWVDADGKKPLRRSQSFYALYGGIDASTTTDRLTAFNGVMVNVAERMANEVACSVTAQDFSLPHSERRLFPYVDPEDLPGVDDEAIRDNLVYLHERVLGEVLAPDDAEIDRTFALFVGVRDQGLAGDYNVNLFVPCRAVGGPDSAYPVEEDPDFTIRAWMAVLAAMLGDYKFLLE